MDDESGCDEPSDDEWPEVDENGNFISPQPQAIPELSVERLNEGLVAAAALDLPAVVELLVRFGARSLYEAFMLAVDEDCPGAVRALITAGADPLANDFRAIRIADKRLCWLESLAGMTDDRSSLLVQTLLECSRHRSPDFRAQYSARQAVEVAMADEANRDPKALIALHQHGLVAIRSEILRYEEENVIPRYFGNNRFAQRRQALFSRAYQDPLVDRNIGLDLGFDSLDDDIPF